MRDMVTDTSPGLKARIAGLLYVFVITFAFVLVMRSGLIVKGDAAATAHSILAAEQLYRFSIFAEFITGAAYIGVTAILYELLRPVSRTVSLMAAFFSLAGMASAPGNLVNLFAPLLLLSGADHQAAFGADQLQALAYMPLRLHGVGFNLSLGFFGFYCLLLGCLIIASTFLPRIIGLLLVLAGFSYLTSTFAFILYPALAAQLVPYILAPPLIGEGALALWLLLVGVNATRWREQVGAPTYAAPA